MVERVGDTTFVLGPSASADRRRESPRPLGFGFSWDTTQGEVAYDEESETWTLNGAVEGNMSGTLARLVLNKMLDERPHVAVKGPKS